MMKETNLALQYICVDNQPLDMSRMCTTPKCSYKRTLNSSCGFDKVHVIAHSDNVFFLLSCAVLIGQWLTHRIAWIHLGQVALQLPDRPGWLAFDCLVFKLLVWCLHNQRYRQRFHFVHCFYSFLLVRRLDEFALQNNPRITTLTANVSCQLIFHPTKTV